MKCAKLISSWRWGKIMACWRVDIKWAALWGHCLAWCWGKKTATESTCRRLKYDVGFIRKTVRNSAWKCFVFFSDFFLKGVFFNSIVVWVWWVYPACTLETSGHVCFVLDHCTYAVWYQCWLITSLCLIKHPNESKVFSHPTGFNVRPASIHV